MQKHIGGGKSITIIHYMENIDSKEMLEWASSRYHYDEEIWTYEEDPSTHRCSTKMIYVADGLLADYVDIVDQDLDEWRKILSQGFYNATLKKRIRMEN